MILSWMVYLLAVILLLLYTYDDGETATPAKKSGPVEISKVELFGNVLMPQYGGTPVYINQHIQAAQQLGDSARENELRIMAKKLFRNRRTPEEQAARTQILRQRWIEKYGDAAIKYDDTVAKFAAMSPEEQAKLIADQEEPTATPKRAARKKAGAK